MNITRKHSDDRMDLYHQDISKLSQFEDKIFLLFQKEFDDKLENILLYNDKEFINTLTAGVYIDLEDLYSTYVLSEQLVQDLLSKYEQIIHDTIYLENFKALNKAWNDYVNKTQEFSILTQFRKHCRFTKAFAKHTCDGNFIQVLEKGKVKYVICVQCRKSYSHDSILMYCNKCDHRYYSVAIPNDEDANIQPATWDSYHCNTMKAEKMRCIKCAESFYYDLTENMLICLTCKFKIAPIDILWNCMVCKVEFKSEARHFNPMEFKFCKQAIRQTLLLKQRAKPYNVPCCGINTYSTFFFHKGECKGELFQGEFDKKTIVVCSKCKTMNYYDKFLWTCPKCLKRFKQKFAEEEVKPMIIKDYKVASHEKKAASYREFITPDVKRTMNRSITVKEDFMSLSPVKRTIIPAKDIKNEPIITPLFTIIEQPAEKKEAKVRSLYDILEERKKINSAKAKNDSAIKVEYSQDSNNSYLKRFKNEFKIEINSER